MLPLPTKCPLTGGQVIVTRIYCPDSGITMEGEQDIYYIQNYSIWLDIQILWRTITVVMRGKGAY